MIDIIFSFQGEEVYRIALPKNTECARFELGDSSEPYGGIRISVPSIIQIKLYNENKIDEA